MIFLPLCKLACFGHRLLSNIQSRSESAVAISQRISVNPFVDLRLSSNIM